VLFGETDSTGCMLDLFESRDAEGRTAIERLPAVVPTQEVAVVEKFLLDQHIQPTAQLATRTVRETVELLTQQFLSVRMWDLCNAQQVTVDVHGAAAAAAAAAASAGSAEAEMFEACTVEAAKAVHETLKVRAEEQEEQFNTEPEPEPELARAGAATPPPEGVPPPAAQTQTIAQWLEGSGLGKCATALEDYLEVIDLQEADSEEVIELLAAVAATGVSKPVLRRFKRELAALRGQGETFA
jgi:hypothetical protein